MVIRYRRLITNILFLVLLSPTSLLAQSTSSESFLNVGLVIMAVIVFITALILVGDNLIGIEAKEGKVNIPSTGGFSRLFAKKPAKYVEGSYHALTRGFDIKLTGEAKKEVESIPVSAVALQPPNFTGMSPIPKVLFEPGQEVLAGDALFFDKKRPDIKYVSPVSGEVAAINRGEKRAITEIVIIPDKEQRYRQVPSVDLNTISREELITFLIDTGAWPFIRQRPYNLVAKPGDVPENIFVSTFDTAPLAPDNDFIIQGQENEWEKGIETLTKLTDGKVYLGLNANGPDAPAKAFTNISSAEKVWFSGPHPVGNVGVQIHHIHPVSSTNIAWVLGVQDVIVIGRLFTEGRFNAERLVALTGQCVEDRKYVRVPLGAKISELVKGQELTDAHRIISGDVLSGHKKSQEGYLDFYDDQLTVIDEGKEYEMFGWLLPLKMRPSTSKTYPNFMFPDVEFEVNTNTHGERRAFVVTGQYENMLPMDIYPQHLMKAILTNDYEKMEGLGIHELAEEDIALCEFACTSKQPLQHILRQGLDMMREQG